MELFWYKLAAELVLSKDNKQQCFKLFKALKNRAIGFYFIFFICLSNDNALYKCECEFLSISKQEHNIHRLDNTQPSILSFDICSLYQDKRVGAITFFVCGINHNEFLFVYYFFMNHIESSSIFFWFDFSHLLKDIFFGIEW